MRYRAKNRMLRSFFTKQNHSNLRIKQVSALLSEYSILTIKHQSLTTSLEISQHASKSPANHTHKQLSSINFTGIAKSVILKSSPLWSNDKGETFSNVCFQNYLLSLSNISPETIRGFWGVSALKPQDVLDILVGFECSCGNNVVELKKVESLWGIFTLAGEQSRDFEHLPQSCKIMGRMLVNVGMFKEAERLLSRLDDKGILLDCRDIFSDMIEGYVVRFRVKSAISCYDRMRLLGLVPSSSCYQALAKYLVQMGETQLAYGTYLDMVETGLGRTKEEMGIYDKVVRLLCKDGRVQEARNLIKKVFSLGINPTSLVLNSIVSGYCKKKDYEDIISLFMELRYAPETPLGNKILHSLCKHFGVERGESLLQRLEQLGFIPDGKTFGILIGWSCRKRKLKSAMIYFSEILSRGLKPDKISYNAIVSCLFKEGMWKHAGDILCEMKDGGVLPDLSTFRVLLAGYFKSRQFDRLNIVLREMAELGLIQFSSFEDPLCKALIILGLSPEFVKIKRDNDKGFYKTDFFDNLGNGLYLDTDLDEYEKAMAKVLNDAMVPDINFVILDCLAAGEMKNAVLMVSEMELWGQELSSSCFSALMKVLCASSSSIRVHSSLLEKMSEFFYDLEEETLNKLVQAYCRRGFTFRARIILEGMRMRHLRIENKTYTLLVKGLCKFHNLVPLHDCWKLAHKHNWTPELEDSRAILGCLCRKNLLREALEFFEVMLAVYPNNFSVIIHAFLENLCGEGLTSTASVLVEELLKRGVYIDHMAFDNLVNGFCKEKKFREAILILDSVLAKKLSLSLDVSVQLIHPLCRAGEFEKAVALKNICSGEEPSSLQAVYRALLSGFCKFDRIEEATSLLQEMLEKGLVPNIEDYNFLVEGYCLGQNFMKVLEILGLMMRRNLTISISCYRNLVHLMCVHGKCKMAWGLKELALVDNDFPKLTRYNILIFYLFSTTRTELVHTLLDELQKKQVQFDEVTCNFLVHGFSQCNDALNSMHYLTFMMSKDFRPSNRSLREIIRCLCSSGELGEVMKLSQDMESRGWVHGEVIQNIIVDSLLCQGKLQEAVNFLRRMVEKGLFPDNVHYEYLIKRLCQHGVPEKAMDLSYIMLKKGKQLDSTSFDYMIQGFSSGNKLDVAIDLLSEMLHRKLKPGTNTWTGLVLGLSENGQAAVAESLLNQMVQLGETPSREIYCCLIDQYRSENNLSKAAKLVQAMQQNGYEPDFETHWSLISNLGESRTNDGASGNRRFLSRLLSQVGFSWKSFKTKKE